MEAAVSEALERELQPALEAAVAAAAKRWLRERLPALAARHLAAAAPQAAEAALCARLEGLSRGEAAGGREEAAPLVHLAGAGPPLPQPRRRTPTPLQRARRRRSPPAAQQQRLPAWRPRAAGPRQPTPTTTRGCPC